MCEKDLILFAGTGGGVAKSTDWGITWTAAGEFIARFQFRESARSEALSLPRRGRAYRSTDNGDHWTTANAGLTTINLMALVTLGTRSRRPVGLRCVSID
jgi:photosystem II stability/assembly factor-like uncharacterized protein